MRRALRFRPYFIAEDCKRSRLATLPLRLPQISEAQSASARPKALCVLAPSDPLENLIIQATPCKEGPLSTFGRDPMAESE